MDGQLPKGWTAKELVQIARDHQSYYTELWFNAIMSLGVMRVASGNRDPQELAMRHEADEFYFVLEGEAMLHLEGREQKMYKGSMVTVPSMVAHYWHDVQGDDIVVLVLFAKWPPQKKAGKQ